MNEDKVEAVIKTVLSSKKYKNLTIDLVRYLSAKEIDKNKNAKETVKAVKNKLHQTAGAYLHKADYSKWIERLTACRDDRQALMSSCMEIMKHHASAKERLPVLTTFYEQIFSYMPGIKSVIDIGCGFNPLALFWMPGARDLSYYAIDIYTDLTSFLKEFFFITGLNGQAETYALLDSCPEKQADAAFLLKMLPVLEQEKPGRGLELLDHLKAKHLVVSFPAKSLGGREKGMVENYTRLFTNIAKDKNWDYAKIEFPLETVFVINKGQTPDKEKVFS